MPNLFAEIAFTDSVKKAQEHYGTRRANERLENVDRLGKGCVSTTGLGMDRLFQTEEKTFLPNTITLWAGGAIVFVFCSMPIIICIFFLYVMLQM